MKKGVIFDPCFSTSLLQVMSSLSLSTICCDTRKNRKKKTCACLATFFESLKQDRESYYYETSSCRRPFKLHFELMEAKEKRGDKGLSRSSLWNFLFFDKKDDLLPEILKKWPTNKKANSFCLKKISILKVQMTFAKLWNNCLQLFRAFFWGKGKVSH